MYLFAFPLLLLVASTICASPVRIESRSNDTAPLLTNSRVVPRGLSLSAILPKIKQRHHPAYDAWLGRGMEKISSLSTPPYEAFPVPRRISETLGITGEVIVKRVEFDTEYVYAKIQGDILNLDKLGKLKDWAWDEESPVKSPSQKSPSKKLPSKYACYIVMEEEGKDAAGPSPVVGHQAIPTEGRRRNNI